MNTFHAMLATSLLVLSVPAQAIEAKNECAWRLPTEAQVPTDCKVNALGKDGNTYCFANERSRTSFLNDASPSNMKGLDRFGRS